MRVRAIPLTEEVEAFVGSHEHTYVVEMNRDGQLHKIISLAYPEYATRLRPVSYLDGLPFTARFVREAILAKEEN